MSRPVGARIIQICETLEICGPLTNREIFETMGGADITNVHRNCIRAVGLRLLFVDRSGLASVYSLQPGWRDRLCAQRHAPRIKTVKAVQPRAAVRRVASVWDLGMSA